jgi:hypothetical protein
MAHIRVTCVNTRDIVHLSAALSHMISYNLMLNGMNERWKPYGENFQFVDERNGKEMKHMEYYLKPFSYSIDHTIKITIFERIQPYGNENYFYFVGNLQLIVRSSMKLFKRFFSPSHNSNCR